MTYIINFDVLAITESHKKKDLSSTINLQSGNYSVEHAPTDRTAIL